MTRRFVSSDLLPPVRRQAHLVAQDAAGGVALPLHVGAEVVAADGAAGGGFDRRAVLKRQRAFAAHPLIQLLGRNADATGQPDLTANFRVFDGSDKWFHTAGW